METKKTLSSPPISTPFTQELPVILQTDSSRTEGLGFALLQGSIVEKLNLFQCGSRFISDTESRYAMVELELLAVTWAIQKCRVYLLGLAEFTLIVDHRPLIPILNDKTMDAIDNPRIMRMEEKLLPYSFTAQ